MSPRAKQKAREQLFATFLGVGVVVWFFVFLSGALDGGWGLPMLSPDKSDRRSTPPIPPKPQIAPASPLPREHERAYPQAIPSVERALYRCVTAGQTEYRFEPCPGGRVIKVVDSRPGIAATGDEIRRVQRQEAQEQAEDERARQQRAANAQVERASRVGVCNQIDEARANNDSAARMPQSGSSQDDLRRQRRELDAQYISKRCAELRGQG